MRMTLSLFAMLLAASVLGGQGKVPHPCSASPADAVALSDPYCYRCVDAAFEMLKGGGSFSGAFHGIPLMGDQASIAIAKLWSADELATAQNTRAYLRLVEIAFANPAKILRREDRNPNVTLLLLDYLEIKQAQDAVLTKQIEFTKRFVKVSVDDP